MKLKLPKNEWVLDKLKNSKDRSITVSDIPWITKEGKRHCIWCGDKLKSQHHATRYCSDEDCALSAYIFCYPQSKTSLFYLLELQNFKCMFCYYDYKPYFKGELTKEEFFKIKKRIPTEFRPEVDHVIAITNGGSALGLDNHQVLCCTCHKNKTKNDMDIKRAK